ncbi:MAG: TonB-dependent receptor plug domain-containing protein [bacterium]
MLNNFLFILAFAFICLSACYGEEPDSTITDTISLKRITVPPLESIYLSEISVWDGLPVLTSLVPGHVASLSTGALRRFHMVGAGAALELTAAGVESCLGYVGQPCLMSIRGSRPRAVLFLKDGIPVNDEMTGAFDVSLVSLVSLKRIEVMSDCGSSVYGPNGSDGVVNLITKTFEGGPPYSRVMMAGGSHNLASSELEFGRSFGESWAGYASGAYVKEDGFRANADADIKDFNGDLSYAFGGMKTGVSVWRRDGKVGIPGDTLGISGPLRREDRLLFAKAYFKGNSFDAGIYYKDLWRGDSDSLGLSTGARRVEGIGGDVKKVFRFGRSRVLLGMAGRRREVDGGDTLSCDVVDGGVTGATSLELLPLVYLNPSVSFWYDEIYGSEVSPKLSLSMIYDLGLVLFGSVGRGFNAPNLRELFSSTSGNLELKPEHVFSYSGGVRYEGDQLSFSAHGFGVETRDLIEAESDSSGLPVNTGFASRVSGVALAGQMSASRFDGGVNLRLITSQYSRTGDEVAYTPRVSVRGYAGYGDVFRQGNLGVSLIGEVRYLGERLSDRGLSLPAYYVLNLCGELRVVDVRLSYRVENILGQAYESVSGYPMPGATFTYGLDWELWN